VAQRLNRLLEVYQAEAVHRLVHDKKQDEARKAIEKNPAVLSQADSQGYYVLHYCAKHDMYDLVRFVVTFSKSLSQLKGDAVVNFNARDANRWTPLHWGTIRSINDA
jgi:ankyrin repeat protein